MHSAQLPVLMGALGISAMISLKDDEDETNPETDAIEPLELSAVSSSSEKEEFQSNDTSCNVCRVGTVV